MEQDQGEEMQIEKKKKEPEFKFDILEWKGVALWIFEGLEDKCSICTNKLDDVCINCSVM